MANPLWLPEGSVRSIIALLSILATIYMLVMVKTVPDWFIAIVSSVVGFYFATRKRD